jgi:alpha-tubulin suppressor-like RCC1 family protein
VGSKSDPASMLLSDQELRRVPTVVEQLRGTRMRMVAAGAAHSVALSEDGAVFTWGDANATRNVDDEYSNDNESNISRELCSQLLPPRLVCTCLFQHFLFGCCQPPMSLCASLA